jgi:ArsR family transcriptional regulator
MALASLLTIFIVYWKAVRPANPAESRFSEQNATGGLDFVLKYCNNSIMDERTKMRLDLRTEVFKALAHPMRLYMLEKLKTKPWCVCELAAEVGVDKSVASKHLSQLKAAGLIADEKRGTLVEYRLIAPCAQDLADCVEKSIMESRRKRLGLASIRSR